MKDYNEVNEVVAKALLAEDLTPEEQLKLADWLTDEKNKELFDQLKDKDNLVKELAFQHQFDVAAGKQIIEQKKHRRRVIKLTRYRYAAAAVIMFAVASVWVFNHNSKTTKQTAGNNNTIAVQKDIPPGTTKAILTLADGSKIVLDSAGNGKLADQAGITISHQNGQLMYKQNGGAVNGSQYNTLATAKGETFVTQLADGTLAWLNAGSSIHYPVSFTGNERVVEITGEVYFEVAHDASKPFHVKILRQDDTPVDIQVLGTHFNVNAYNDDEIIKTTLLEGSVKISAVDKIKILKPQQQAQVSNSDNRNEKDIRVISDVNTDEVIAWKNGVFNFNGAEIPAALRQIARWYNIEIVYEGEVPRDKFMGEVERNLTLSQALKILEHAGLQFTVQGRKLIVKQQ
jgi:ferric-dicitrate binding protein FerR (iron transport regulator)